MKPFAVRRRQERGDAVAVAGFAAGAREDQIALRLVDAGVPGFAAVDDPVVAVAPRHGLHVRRIGAVIRLGDAERKAALAREHRRYPFLLLLFGAVMQHQQQADVVADDRVFVLQIVVQPETFRGEMFADHRHAEVGAVFAAVFLRERIAIVAGVVGELAGFREQRFPVLRRQTAAVPVGARVFAAMIEEADVVVRILERLDFLLDEVVEFDEIVGQIFWNVEIHRVFLPLLFKLSRYG